MTTLIQLDSRDQAEFYLNEIKVTTTIVHRGACMLKSCKLQSTQERNKTEKGKKEKRFNKKS